MARDKPPRKVLRPEFDLHQIAFSYPDPFTLYLLRQIRSKHPKERLTEHHRQQDSLPPLGICHFKAQWPEPSRLFDLRQTIQSLNCSFGDTINTAIIVQPIQAVYRLLTTSPRR